jgi:uncharacterized membrane protein
MHSQRCFLILIGCLILLAAFQVIAAQDSGSPAKKPARPSEPTEIQEVQEVKPAETLHTLSFSGLIGRMHPAIVHFPIGWIVLLLLVETIAMATRREEWDRAGFVLLLGALASMLPAAATGFLLASSLGGDPDVVNLVSTHRNLNIASGLTCMLALVFRSAWRSNFNSTRRWIYLSFIAIATFLMLLAGHFGGKMVFGKDYLPF